MSYQVLARSWRPKNFQTLIGQEHVSRALINALNNQRLHHAYLFTGTRGVGKTTIARILAKCLNCETGITAEPCGKCHTCLEIDEGRFIDLMEVDAASRTKVEDTRELLENVPYAPTQGRFKIYLIDEVHMLSGHSFNALLKTLEEPPSHVKFLLATTDPQKLPVTVLSRCLQFHLKHLPPEKIDTYLQHVLTEEKIPFESKATFQIARAAAGSMRDALSILDQAIAFTHHHINYSDISVLLGLIEKNHLETLMNALAKKDGLALLNLCNHLAETGADFKTVLEELLEWLHQIAVAQVVSQAPYSETIQKFAQQFSKEDIQLYYQIVLIGLRDLPLAPYPKSGFEMILLRLLAFNPVSQKVSDPHSALGKQAQTVVQPVAISRPNASSDRSTTTPSAQPAETPSDYSAKHAIPWETLITQLSLTGLTYELASHCTLKSLTDHHIELMLSPNCVALLTEKTQIRLSDALNKFFNKPLKLLVHIGASKEETPAEKIRRSTQEQHDAAVSAIKSDPIVQSMVEKLGVNLDPKLIQTV